MSDSTPLFEHFGATFEAGSIIFSEGEAAAKMYIIQSGRVKVIKNVHNTEHVLAELGKGDFFGEMAIVTNDTRFATAVALSRIEALAFSREDLSNLITKNTRVAFNIIEKLCRRLANANLCIKHLLNIGKLGIVSLLLIDIFTCAGKNESIPLSEVIEELAARLKTRKEHIFYFLEIFKADRSVEIHDDKISIGDKAKLEKYVEIAFEQQQ